MKRLISEEEINRQISIQLYSTLNVPRAYRDAVLFAEEKLKNLAIEFGKFLTLQITNYKLELYSEECVIFDDSILSHSELFSKFIEQREL